MPRPLVLAITLGALAILVSGACTFAARGQTHARSGIVPLMPAPPPDPHRWRDLRGASAAELRVDPVRQRSDPATAPASARELAP